MIDYDLLLRLVNDYEHCAPDEGGNIARWRKNLIAKLRTLLA